MKRGNRFITIVGAVIATGIITMFCLSPLYAGGLSNATPLGLSLRFMAQTPLEIADISVSALRIGAYRESTKPTTLPTEIAPSPIARIQPSPSAASPLPASSSSTSLPYFSTSAANGYVNLDGTTRSDIMTPAQLLSANAQLYKITFYCACLECCGKTNGITASGVHAQAGVTIAASGSIPFGTRIWIEGYGERVVQDRGGAIGTNRIDIYVNTHSEALRQGTRTVRIWFL